MKRSIAIALFTLAGTAASALAQASLTIIQPTGGGDAFLTPFSDALGVSGNGQIPFGEMVGPNLASNGSAFFVAGGTTFNPIGNVNTTSGFQRVGGRISGSNSDGTLLVGFQRGSNALDAPGLLLVRDAATNATTPIVLNDLPGGTNFSAFALDVSNGLPAQVVGFTTPGGVATASFWTYTTGATGPLAPTVIPAPSGAGFGNYRATSISGNGQVVVGYGTATGNLQRAWVSENSGTSSSLLPLPSGYLQSQALSVSTDGSTIVGYVQGSTPDNDGCVWTKVAGVWTAAVDTNVARFVGTSANGAIKVGYNDAFSGTRTIAGQTISIDSKLLAAGVVIPAGTVLVEVNGCSDDGTVVVGEADVANGMATDDRSFVAVLPLGPTPCGPSDIAGPGPVAGADGEVTADDIIFFISAFTGSNLTVADIAGPGPVVGADGELTADDIILFITRFTTGC
jgi:hypothetical protein